MSEERKLKDIALELFNEDGVVAYFVPYETYAKQPRAGILSFLNSLTIILRKKRLLFSRYSRIGTVVGIRGGTDIAVCNIYISFAGYTAVCIGDLDVVRRVVKKVGATVVYLYVPLPGCEEHKGLWRCLSKKLGWL